MYTPKFKIAPWISGAGLDIIKTGTIDKTYDIPMWIKGWGG